MSVTHSTPYLTACTPALDTAEGRVAMLSATGAVNGAAACPDPTGPSPAGPAWGARHRQELPSLGPLLGGRGGVASSQEQK